MIEFETFLDNRDTFDVQSALFDFDGVILDTTELKFRSFVKAAETTKARSSELLIPELHGSLCGAERKEIASWMKTQFGVSEELFIDHFKANLHLGFNFIKPNNAILDLLSDLSSHEVKLGIVSAAPRQSICDALTEMRVSETIFALGIHGSESGKKTRVLSEIAQRSHLRLEDTFFFGDMPSDLDAATSVGINFVRVQSWGGKRASWPATVKSTNSDS